MVLQRRVTIRQLVLKNIMESNCEDVPDLLKNKCIGQTARKLKKALKI